MIDLLKSRMDEVYDVVLVANTPVYLYKNLRRVLLDIANEVPFETLVSELREEVASSPNEEYDQASYIYALFVLMTYGRYEDVRPHLGWIGSSDAELIDYLISHYRRSVVQITSVSHPVQLSLIKKSDSIGVQSSHDVTTKTIDLNEN